MVKFEEAAAMLDEAVDALPQEIFDKLNGGVNLIPARRTDEHGLLVMGMYFVDQMGRHERAAGAVEKGAHEDLEARAHAPHRVAGL